jgi:WD repeat-containing protein 68
VWRLSIARRSHSPSLSPQADGCVLVFDVRDLRRGHSINCDLGFQQRQRRPLVRVAWSHGGTQLAALSSDGDEVVTFDSRRPYIARSAVGGGLAPINAIAWNPACDTALVVAEALALGGSRVGDGSGGETPCEPLLRYDAKIAGDGASVRQIDWNAATPQWLAVAFAESVQLLHGEWGGRWVSGRVA